MATDGSKAGGHFGRGNLTLLGMARLYPTPTAGDAKMSGSEGYSTESGRHSGTTLTDATGRLGPLNPTWVEWLMGFPSGWTVLED
jgi:hypothetical protein